MITTKRGDWGVTDCDGKRVCKDNLLIEVIGEIDELQAMLELIDGDKKVIKYLRVVMGGLGSCRVLEKQRKKCKISGIKLQIKRMENEIEKNQINLNEFLIFKKKKAKELNWVRTVSRRVERKVVALSKKQEIDKEILKYFNRLSDYLFILALENN